jgi:hypothetical protein
MCRHRSEVGVFAPSLEALLVAGHLQAYREGNVGWSIDRDALFRLADGTEVPFRNTCVFVEEDGEWKLIHGHTSIGVRNEEMFGEDLTA